MESIVAALRMARSSWSADSLFRDAGFGFSGDGLERAGREPHPHRCGRCEATGRIWIGCEQAGFISVRCPCGAAQHPEGYGCFFAELAFAMVTLVALSVIVACLGVRW
jgi:hypothetical protein